MKMLWIAGLLTAAFGTWRAERQESSPDLAARAAAILAAEVGVWDCRWEYFGPDGEVVGAVEGTETARELFPGRVLAGETSLPSVGRESRGFRFYEPNRKKLMHISIGSDGDFWILEQEVGSDVLESRPHTNADGSVTRIRFVSLEHDDDRHVVRMEQLGDDGEWELGFRQTMVRRE